MAAVGDILVWKSAGLTNNSTYTVKPSASDDNTSTEAIVTNLYWTTDKAIELYLVDGTTTTKFYPATGEGNTRGSLTPFWDIKEASNPIHVQVKNVSGGAIDVWASGRKLK